MVKVQNEDMKTEADLQQDELMDIGTIIIASISIITLGFTICVCTKITVDYKLEERKIAYDTAKMYFQVVYKIEGGNYGINS